MNADEAPGGKGSEEVVEACEACGALIPREDLTFNKCRQCAGEAVSESVNFGATLFGLSLVGFVLGKLAGELFGGGAYWIGAFLLGAWWVATTWSESSENQ